MTILQDAHERNDIEDIVIECTLDEPLQKVWRALTVPAYVARWLPGYEGSLQAAGLVAEAPGTRSQVEYSVLAAEAPHLLRYAWRERDGNRIIHSIVTFNLDPTGDGGTNLRIVHGGFSATPVAANGNVPALMMLAA